MSRLYFPDGGYKEVGKEEQVPDLTPEELIASHNVLNYLLHKYGSTPFKDAFPKLKKEATEIFERDFGFAVEVKPLLFPTTPDEISYYNLCVLKNFPPITIEISHRIDWKEGDHERELYEWKERKNRKKAFARRLSKWL